MTVTKGDIKKSILESKLNNKTLCIHSSLKSFGEVIGGANTVIDAFLESGCTILAPAFQYDFQIPAIENIEQNGDYEYENSLKPHHRIYSTNISNITADMGAIPKAMVNTKGRHRGNHPSDSFVALGPHAEELICVQTFENVYGPFQKMIEMGSKIIMMGVGLNKMTAIHYAEQLSGRELYVRWALDHNGNPARYRMGSCSEGFERLAPAISHLEQKTTVGNSAWRIYPIKETVYACADAIGNNPESTHCDNSDCKWCNDMQKGGPILNINF
ncbi:MAG: AAC(3) family N-acetyltransferase [Oscillospiraceae bacterium]|nr:AAC(3) family N-acetyltransferase [Oscillospiraceae bacterium]